MSDTRNVYLPLEKLDECFGPTCTKRHGIDGVKLRLCVACGEAAYCSEECQKADWKKHKKNCGITDRVDLQDIWPFFACMIYRFKLEQLPPIRPVMPDTAPGMPRETHPALTHKLTQVGETRLQRDFIPQPDGSIARKVVLGDPLPPMLPGMYMTKASMCGRKVPPTLASTQLWWPGAPSESECALMGMRIMAEGMALSSHLAMAVCILAEMYTTTAMSEQEAQRTKQPSGRRRVRLTHNKSPISDFGIAVGSLDFLKNERRMYFDRSGKLVRAGQDPKEHYWIYFKTLAGDEHYLDCNAFTLNWPYTIDATPYNPLGMDGSFDQAPGFYFSPTARQTRPGWEEEHGHGPSIWLPHVGWTPKARFSVLRDEGMHRCVKSKLAGGIVGGTNIAPMQSLQQRIAWGAGSEFDAQEYIFLMHFIMDGVPVLRRCIEGRTYLKFPEAPDVITVMTETRADAPTHSRSEMDPVFERYWTKRFEEKKLQRRYHWMIERLWWESGPEMRERMLSDTQRWAEEDKRRERK